jgi:hypothetical protein
MKNTIIPAILIIFTLGACGDDTDPGGDASFYTDTVIPITDASIDQPEGMDGTSPDLNVDGATDIEPIPPDSIDAAHPKDLISHDATIDMAVAPDAAPDVTADTLLADTTIDTMVPAPDTTVDTLPTPDATVDAPTDATLDTTTDAQEDATLDLTADLFDATFDTVPPVVRFTVSPAGGFNSEGHTGGPFSPPNTTYTLHNPTQSSLNFSIGNNLPSIPFPSPVRWHLAPQCRSNLLSALPVRHSPRDNTTARSGLSTMATARKPRVPFLWLSTIAVPPAGQNIRATP